MGHMLVHRVGRSVIGGILVALLVFAGTVRAVSNVPATCGEMEISPVPGFQPLTADTLTVVTTLPVSGFWLGSATDPEKMNAGFEYCLAKAMQAAFGLANFTVRMAGFDALVAGTLTGYDIAITRASITDERKKVVEFTQPYFESEQSALVKGDSDLKLSTLAEAKKLQYGIQTGTTAIDLVEKWIKPEKEARMYQNLADAYAAVDAGQIDAVLIDTALNLGHAAESNGKFKVIAQFTQPGGQDLYGGILPKGSPNVQAFNSVIEELKTKGKLAELAKTQLKTDPGAIPTIKLGD